MESKAAAESEQVAAELSELRHMRALSADIKQNAKAALEKELSRMERLSLQRRCSKVSRELKQAEQNLFMRHSALDKELDEQIQEFMRNAKLAATIERLFVVQVSGTV